MLDGFRADVKAEGRLKQYLAKVKDIKTVTEVGFLKGETYPDGTSVAYVAYLNEFGQHNPPRPFLKRTMERQFKRWTGLIHHVLKAGGFSRENVRTAYNQVGITAVADVQKTIKAWSPSDPRYNKPATIKAKARGTAKRVGGKNQVGNDPLRVLHDTGVMMNSIKYEVKE